MKSQNTGFYRKPELKKITGLSDSTVWRMEKAGNFPKRKQITSRLVGWSRQEVIGWIESREVAA
ncbi:MAG: AlpA family phage regulatory protein [Pseudomonadota bacterium]